MIFGTFFVSSLKAYMPTTYYFIHLEDLLLQTTIEQNVPFGGTQTLFCNSTQRWVSYNFSNAA